MNERKALLLRMRPEFYEALRRWADDEFRSVNGQIEYLLQKALAEAGRGAARDRGSGSEPPPDPSG